MPWPATGNDEQGVDAKVVAVPEVARRKPFGGDGDPAQPIIVQREGGGNVVGPRLHLDEGESVTPPSDDIDFAARNARAAREDRSSRGSADTSRRSFGASAPLLRAGAGGSFAAFEGAGIGALARDAQMLRDLGRRA